jgi:phosphatidylserine/phosphatidylglycerophosphate/cardiolipin synthase-like enzyme
MRKIINFVLLSAVLVGCVPILTQGNVPTLEQIPPGRMTPDALLPSEFPIPATQLASSGIDVYFSDPLQRKDGQYTGGPDEVLADAIRAAKVTVDVAIYSLNLWSIRDALLDANQRGVQIRMVMESDNMDDDVPQELIAAGISILGDRREGLMHNKFVIIDRQDVWTGSMNLTLGGVYYDNNNLIHLRSIEMAEDYLQEFNEMFIMDMFGTDVIPQTPYPEVLVGNTRVNVYFSPDDQAARHLVELISSAQESIYFMAYSFTANDLGAAIVERAQAGITVAGVMDEGQINSNKGTEYDPFIQAGINVFKDGNSGLMHHKVIIIDRKIVITGSYNFSKSAETTNDENVLVVFSPEIASLYLAEFERVLDQALRK